MSNGAIPSNNGQYQTFAPITGTDNQCTNAIWLLPPSFTYDGATNSVSVPNVYLPSATPPPVANDDFAVTWSPSPPTTTAATSIGVQVLNKNQWCCADAARAALRASFANLYAALDAMEYPAANAVLLPGSTALVMRAVAGIVPAPLVESLFYYHGFSSGLHGAAACPYVDLTPGMRLEVQPEPSEFVGVGSTANGPVAAAPVTLQLNGVMGDDGYRRLSFDRFLATAAAPTIANQGGPQVAIAGAVDLQAAGNARRWWRLLYPTQLPPSGSVGDGLLSDSVTLVGAETRADLELATASYQTGQPATGQSKPLVYAVLRGRTTAVPLVPVTVIAPRSSALTWVPLGTSFRDVADARVLSNPATWSPNTTTDLQVTASRQSTSAVPPLYTQVSFNPGAAALVDPRGYELPMVQGDTVQIQGT